MFFETYTPKHRPCVGPVRITHIAWEIEPAPIKYNAQTDVSIPRRCGEDAAEMEAWLEGREYSMYYLTIDRIIFSYTSIEGKTHNTRGHEHLDLIRFPNPNDAVLFKLFFHEGD